MEQTIPTYTSRKGIIYIYVTVVFLYWISLYVYLPTLSVYTASKVGNLTQVGTVLAMYGLWQAVARFPLGIAADWVGRRKPFIIAGFVLSGLGAVLMGLAGGMVGLTLGRALTGFAASAWVLLVVVFSSQFPPEEAVRASALLSGVNAVARMLATGITGVLNTWGGEQLSFFVATGIAGAAVLVMLPLRERPYPPQKPSLRGLQQLSTRRDVLFPSLICAVMQYAVWTASFSYTPVLAKNMRATNMDLSLLTSLNIASVMLANFATSALVKRVGARAMIIFSFVAMGISMGVLTFTQTLPWVFFAQACSGLASGVGYSVLMGLSIRYVDESQRATAMGLFQAIYAIGMFTGPWLSGILADSIGLQPMFGIVGIACTVVGLWGAQQLTARETVCCLFDRERVK
ncbi:MAG: MFS transporter [Anaerolineae bacterium]|nr:MFS transporter [Anaerolineae bacterium]